MPSYIRSNGELNLELIFNELRDINNSLDDAAAERMSREVIECRGKIVGLGAGRMGYSLQAFVMRLSHLGYLAYMLGDTSVPRIGVGDLVLINSSSGETPSVCLLAEIAKKNGAKVILLTSGRGSTLAKLADEVIHYKKTQSVQLMKTLYEQFSYLFFDSCASYIAMNGNLSIKEIETNHSILE